MNLICAYWVEIDRREDRGIFSKKRAIKNVFTMSTISPTPGHIIYSTKNKEIFEAWKMELAQEAKFTYRAGEDNGASI